MECVEAQQVISAALDRETVDPVALHEAKAHCRSCADCTAFVRTLALIQRSPGPEPPEDLPDRVMSKVREFQTAEKSRREREALTSRRTAEQGAVLEDRPRPQTLMERLRDPRARAEVIAWAGMAAVVLVGVGFGAVLGVRQILAPQTDVARTAAGREEMAAKEAPTADSLAAAPTVPTPGAGTAQAAAPVAYISVGNAVFRAAGAADIDRAGLTPQGTVVVALAPDGPVESRQVLAGADGSRLYVPDDENHLIAFDKVTRVFEGRTYQLASSQIRQYGEWPTFPAGLTPPSQADGSPGYEQVGTDPTGAVVFVRTGSSPEQGIAIAPGTPASDPAAGNPNWTWWMAVQ